MTVSNLQKGTSWDCRDPAREGGSSNDKAQENAKETQGLTEDDKCFGSPRAPTKFGLRISASRVTAQVHNCVLLLPVSLSPEPLFCAVCT